ncbi:hypothetical protein ACJXDE_12845 (plasmid) [Enterococcus faecium]|uniref:hypothetical protein n=1 Tax=Enterococcus faecium TaxID=1352 RepID=UPI0038D4AD26
MKKIEIGDLYYYKTPGIPGYFQVKIIEKLKSSGYIAEVISYTQEQAVFLEKDDFKINVRGTLLLDEKRFKKETKIISDQLEIQKLRKEIESKINDYLRKEDKERGSIKELIQKGVIDIQREIQLIEKLGDSIFSDQSIVTGNKYSYFSVEFDRILEVEVIKKLNQQQYLVQSNHYDSLEYEKIFIAEKEQLIGKPFCLF